MKQTGFKVTAVPSGTPGVCRDSVEVTDIRRPGWHFYTRREEVKSLLALNARTIAEQAKARTRAPKVSEMISKAIVGSSEGSLTGE